MSSPLISRLSSVQRELTQYVYSIWLIFGVTGCVLNLVIFSRPKMRTTSCCVCEYQFLSSPWRKKLLFFLVDFFAASVDHLFTLIVGIGPVMQSLNYPDPQTASILFCKLRGYIFQISLMLSRWFVAFACIDRYASSSGRVLLRSFARTTVAYRIIVLIVIFWSIICSHRVIFYEIKGNLCGILTNSGAAIYHTLYVVVGGGVLPATIMIACALLIRRNLASKKQKRSQKTAEEARRNIADQQVFRLLFIQIISYIIFTIPQLGNLVFNALSSTIPNRSSERLAIERLLAFMAELMLYMFPVTSFYLYSLTSRTFRSELIKCVHFISWARLRCCGARIVPLTAQSAAVQRADHQQPIIRLDGQSILQPCEQINQAAE